MLVYIYIYQSKFMCMLIYVHVCLFVCVCVFVYVCVSLCIFLCKHVLELLHAGLFVFFILFLLSSFSFLKF